MKSNDNIINHLYVHMCSNRKVDGCTFELNMCSCSVIQEYKLSSMCLSLSGIKTFCLGIFKHVLSFFYVLMHFDFPVRVRFGKEKTPRWWWMIFFRFHFQWHEVYKVLSGLHLERKKISGLDRSVCLYSWQYENYWQYHQWSWVQPSCNMNTDDNINHLTFSYLIIWKFIIIIIIMILFL